MAPAERGLSRRDRADLSRRTSRPDAASSSSAREPATCSRRCGRRGGSASTSARRWSSSRGRGIRSCGSSRSRRGARAGETFDYVVLSDVVPYVHDLLALFENVRRALASAHARGDQLLQPHLAACPRARGAAAAAARASRSGTGSRRGTSGTCSSSPGFEVVSSSTRILLPEARAVALDVPQRRSSATSGRSPSSCLRLLDRRAARAASRSESSR